MEILPTKLLGFNYSKFINDNGYGRYIFRQVREWSDLMEEGISELPYYNIDSLTEEESTKKWLETVEYLRENAEKLSLETEACNGGLTGFQQDCATNILITTWRYGYKLWVALSLHKNDKGFTIRNEEQKEVIKKYEEKNYTDLLKNEKEIQNKIY